MANQIETLKICALNDAFRATMKGGKVCFTDSVANLPRDVCLSALRRVSMFDDFPKGNDPYGEHDFGTFQLDGRSFFWKIDYYDSEMEHGSEDPADPAVTTRVLTLMLAEDY